MLATNQYDTANWFMHEIMTVHVCSYLYMSSHATGWLIDRDAQSRMLSIAAMSTLLYMYQTMWCILPRYIHATQHITPTQLIPKSQITLYLVIRHKIVIHALADALR